MTNNSDAKKSSRKKLGKIVGAICLVIGIIWMIGDAQKGVEKASEWHGLDSEIQLVQNGHFSEYPKKTIGEAVDGFFGDTEWESGIGAEGETLVNARGKMFYMEKEVEGLIQFIVDKEEGTFVLNTFEINGVPQDQSMINALIGKMFE